jgi:hypothetical protein
MKHNISQIETSAPAGESALRIFEDEYKRMAQNKKREVEALEWVEATISDISIDLK